MREFIKELIEKLTKKKEYYRKEWNRRWDDEDYGYLSAYEDSINLVAQLAEEHNNDFCKWKRKSDYWETHCDYHIKEAWFPAIFDATIEAYHCPYCGKQIKVAEPKGEGR